MSVSGIKRFAGPDHPYALLFKRHAGAQPLPLLECRRVPAFAEELNDESVKRDLPKPCADGYDGRFRSLKQIAQRLDFRTPERFFIFCNEGGGSAAGIGFDHCVQVEERNFEQLRNARAGDGFARSSMADKYDGKLHGMDGFDLLKHSRILPAILLQEK